MNEVEIQKAMIEGLKERKLKVEKELGEIQTEINEREKIAKQTECHPPIFINDEINPEIVEAIKLILQRLGFERKYTSNGVSLRYQKEGFSSYQQILDLLLTLPTNFLLTEKEETLMMRFSNAVNSIRPRLLKWTKE